MALQQQSGSDTRVIDPGLYVLIDEHTTEADVQELLALAQEYLDEQVFNNPDALLAILSRVSRLAQLSGLTQAQIIALMEQVANSQAGRFRRLIRLLLSGVLKKLKGGRYKVGAIAFYGGIDDMDDIDRRNQYEVPRDPANKAIFNEAQNGVVRQQGEPYNIDEVFYGSEQSRDTLMQAENLMVEQALQKREQWAKAIEAGADVNIDELMGEVDQFMQTFNAQVMGKEAVVDESSVLQAAR